MIFFTKRGQAKREKGARPKRGLEEGRGLGLFLNGKCE
jgi:hypothetical protein